MEKSWKNLLEYEQKEKAIWKTTMMKIKKAKDTKTSIVKRKLKFQDYKNSLKAGQIERKINYLRKKLM